MTLNVFISHSGARALRVAVHLKRALQCVVSPVNYCLVPEVLEPHGPWPRGLLQQVRAADFGIACVTQEGCTGGQLYFEAGLLAGGQPLGVPRERRFIAVLIDIDPHEFAATGNPLGLFRPATFDREGFRDLAAAINSYLPAPLDAGELARRVQLGWSQLEPALSELRLAQELDPGVTPVRRPRGGGEAHDPGPQHVDRPSTPQAETPRGERPAAETPRPVDQPVDPRRPESARRPATGALNPETRAATGASNAGIRAALLANLGLLRTVMAGQAQAIQILDEVESLLGSAFVARTGDRDRGARPESTGGTSAAADQGDVGPRPDSR